MVSTFQNCLWRSSRQKGGIPHAHPTGKKGTPALWLAFLARFARSSQLAALARSRALTPIDAHSVRACSLCAQAAHAARATQASLAALAPTELRFASCNISSSRAHAHSQHSQHLHSSCCICTSVAHAAHALLCACLPWHSPLHICCTCTHAAGAPPTPLEQRPGCPHPRLMRLCSIRTCAHTQRKPHRSLRSLSIADPPGRFIFTCSLIINQLARFDVNRRRHYSSSPKGMDGGCCGLGHHAELARPAAQIPCSATDLTTLAHETIYLKQPCCASTRTFGSCYPHLLSWLYQHAEFPRGPQGRVLAERLRSCSTPAARHRLPPGTTSRSLRSRLPHHHRCSRITRSTVPPATCLDHP